MMKRSLPCDCCGIEVELSRSRLRQLAKESRRPLCEQCRRYVSTGTARRSEPIGETRDVSLVLAAKQGRNSKKSTALASQPLRRCGAEVK